MLDTHTAHTLEVPGARLHYELRGSGPLLALVGAPMGGEFFVEVADRLAGERTVLTYDPRGISRSVLTAPAVTDTPELRADDVRRLVAAARTDGPVDVFGSSGGAVTGLALVQAHPGLLRTLVAHEPPVTELLPDAADQHAFRDRLERTFAERGPDAAMLEFMAGIGVDPSGMDLSAIPEAALAEMRANNNYFFGHQLRGTTEFVPDVAVLRAASTRVVIGVGTTNPEQITQRTSAALAELLGEPTVPFPGDHGGFIGEPAAFADRLREVLAG
ncbi:MAG TPA: alpha/beta hydrolase [Pseudonocardia sp.]|jgi:pimeloyl-ACP methyl ester carboxylesterase